MPSHFSDLIASEVFEIVAESGKKRFFVHSSTLARQPKPLRSTTIPAWTEATEKKINLSGWDSDTVGRLVEFLYLENYKGVNGAEEVKDETNTIDTAQGLTDQQERVGDIDALLSHAQVYALAQQEEIEELKTMALAHFSTALTGVKSEGLEQPVMGKVAERLCEIGKYTQVWKDKVVVLDNKIQELEQSEANNAALARVKELEQSEATNVARIKKLEADIRKRKGSRKR